MSAGLATRMRPLTTEFPKCLLRVKGTEMLDMWLSACVKAEAFERVFVNVHHCPQMVFEWLTKWKRLASKKFGRKSAAAVETIDETTKLLGTAGTLFWHGDTAQDFFLAYTDTYSQEMMRKLPVFAGMWADNPDKALAGLVTFNPPADGSCGMMEVDRFRTITNFVEKGGDGIVGWAGMMFGKPEFYDQIRREDFDLARDVFPRLSGKLIAFQHVDAYDIGRGIEEYEHFNAKV